ncbi:hypothetical protein L21SP5_01581 [Salinivirga cyanobacteriivorans]|uniref:Uncharacterized protein n=1 Tax=Salinivirga cyanobacteriivorans TaxID=1307839 RepID=A0A0S2HYX1_9BACT|nr:autotransporter outer membrane beta-barrel domain-containing protein [Salinivirga cyanobacteriivorans]ALO15227.1 hypothetical protein L21SP5_01581 [Salinivirga cyanobacteriivorans]
MRKIVALVLVLSFYSSIGLAQIEREIKNYKDSTVVLANKAKSLMLKYAAEERPGKVAEIYGYINERVTDRKTNLYTYSSELYVLLLSRQWELWIAHARKCRQKFGNDLYPGVKDFTDQYFYELQNQVPQIRQDLKASALPEVDKAMLNVFLELIEAGGVNKEYESALKKFKRYYPRTKYDDFIGRYLPVVNVDFMIASEFGPQALIPIGELSNTFDWNVGFYFGGTFQIEKVYLNFSVGFGNLGLNYPVDAQLDANQVTFEENEDFYFYDYSIEAGYTVYDKKSMRITPYFSFGDAELDSPDFNYEGDDTFIDVFSSRSYGPGLRFSWTLAEFNYRTFYGHALPAQLDLFAKGGYRFLSGVDDELFSGDMAYFSVGIVFGVNY